MGGRLSTLNGRMQRSNALNKICKYNPTGKAQILAITTSLSRQKGYLIGNFAAVKRERSRVGALR
jgi:hypothetical protein